MLGKLQPEDIELLLKSQIVGRIGCSADGKPYVLPISYAYDGTYIYCRTLEGLKTAIMRKNPSVCFQVDNTPNMANWQSVIAWGDYEELEDKTLRTDALKKLTDRILPMISSETTHLFPHWPFPSEDLSEIEGIVFRILLKEKTGRFESNHQTMKSSI